MNSRSEWRTVTVQDAARYQVHPQLYASPRGHAIVSIRYSGDWYVVEYASGGKRYVKPDKLLYYRSIK